jgi:lysyl-tRNA synthetase class 2
MTNVSTKEVFIKRTKIIDSMRKKMNEIGYLEVETPMMHPLAGGAVARPFVTQHNALGQDLYLRIAPELYLKRLLVGGFEKVFEINRSFRNEGLSTKHNPEFTMMEWYEAYASMQEQMDLTRDIILNAAVAASCDDVIEWDGISINLKKFNQSTLTELVLSHNKDLIESDTIDEKKLANFLSNKKIKVEKSWGAGRMLLEIFEETVEPKLINPTFVTEYPVEVSPLSRRNENKPDFADRFELFIGGKEFANGFCELNDPDDQASRFEDQVAAKDSGDKEAMDYDQDYITALEHGMPPAVGVGLGVDRLVMLLTNQSSIRDVLLFPQLKS